MGAFALQSKTKDEIASLFYKGRLRKRVDPQLLGSQIRLPQVHFFFFFGGSQVKSRRGFAGYSSMSDNNAAEARIALQHHAPAAVEVAGALPAVAA